MVKRLTSNQEILSSILSVSIFFLLYFHFIFSSISGIYSTKMLYYEILLKKGIYLPLL